MWWCCMSLWWVGWSYLLQRRLDVKDLRIRAKYCLQIMKGVGRVKSCMRCSRGL